MKKKKFIRSRSALLTALLIGVSALPVSAQPIVKDQVFFDAVRQYIDRNYALSVSDQQLYDAAIKGMFDALDPYSEYMTAAEYKKFKDQTTGTHYGIGVVLGKDAAGGFQVTGVIKGSPAEAAGMKAGDRILAINQKKIGSGMTTDELVEQVKGVEGTEVQLSIIRGSERRDFSILRKKFHLVSAEARVLQDQIGYLRIREFQEATHTEVAQLIRQLSEKGVRRLVLDLRENHGGTLRSAVSIANYFVPKGKIVEVRYKSRQPDIYLSEGELKFEKVAVLVSENTASAAEILAGSIKDTGAGMLIGKKTFGKGVIQDVFPLQNGEAIKLTIARYVLPSGVDIHGRGVAPHYPMDNPAPSENKDLQLQAAFNYLRAN
ncbi:MAG: S41 family peptidase [Peptostreptococcaceae bacterium]|nr:S41 family peptidase [Peptostreptococcaceae bacterium]